MQKTELGYVAAVGKLYFIKALISLSLLNVKVLSVFIIANILE